ncbi:MAG: hypothetical protein PHQ04_00135 [Opitutaceae bacterium]|nr:hypothetical protein [Opitutaceae bacterium]
MALKVTKALAWVAQIDDRPGALASCLGALAAAGANLQCVIGRRQPNKPGTGVVFVAPLKGRKVQKAAIGAGFHATAHVATLHIEGNDKPGLGAEIARVVGAAGVNMRGLSAATIGRKFVTYLSFDSPADATKAAAAIRRARL